MTENQVGINNKSHPCQVAFVITTSTDFDNRQFIINDELSGRRDSGSTHINIFVRFTPKILCGSLLTEAVHLLDIFSKYLKRSFNAPQGRISTQARPSQSDMAPPFATLFYS